jgi:hypothetical protein
MPPNKPTTNKLTKEPAPTPTEPTIPHSSVTLDLLWNALAQTFLDRLNDTENPPRGSTLDTIRRWLADNGATLGNMKTASGPTGIRQGNQFNALSTPFDRLTEAVRELDQEGNSDARQ